MPVHSIFAKLLPIIPRTIVHKVARKYIAGDELDDALRAIRGFNGRGIRGTIDILGEFVTRMEQTADARAMDLKILDGIKASGVNANLSVKLTTIGLRLDFEYCCRTVKEILAHAASMGNFVRLDMEDSPCTTLTLDLYRRMRAEGFTNVGVVLQAYMRRSAQDIDALPSDGLNVRLCKGIYRESEGIAFQGREEVQRNYKLLLRKLFDKGAYVGIATHDDLLIDDACDLVAARHLPQTAYEFQMLLGVREERREEIVRSGHSMRVYVPFGRDWYGYASRRLKENPLMAYYIVKAIVTTR
jgi:proline dehydrogenase